MLRNFAFLTASTLIVMGCSQQAEPAPVDAPTSPTPAAIAVPVADMAAIEAAIAHPERSADDQGRDASRLPAQTLAFAGVQPGLVVLELEAGDGYFTEILSRAVGEDGRVLMQNPSAFDQFPGFSLEERLGEDRLPNVVVTRTNFDALESADASVDMVTWIQGPHELWFSIAGEGFGDAKTSFAEIARVLKPGGVFVAIDHRAADGTGTEAGATLHRIHEDIITDMATEAGLVLIDTSDILTRSDDPLTNNVFDQSIRGRTNQFVSKFQKPAG